MSMCRNQVKHLECVISLAAHTHFVILTIVFIAVGCEASRFRMEEHNMNQAQQAAYTQKVQAEDANVQLQAEFIIEADHIAIRYQVTSRTEVPLLLFDALHQRTPDGTQTYNPLLSFISYEEPSTLAIKRINPPPPEMKDVFLAYTAWAHKLSATAPLKGEIRVPLPAEEYNPYYPPGSKSVYRKVSAQGLKLVLEYAPLTGSLRATPVSGTKDLFQLEGTGVRLQQVHVSIKLNKPVAVNRRSDMFEPI